MIEWGSELLKEILFVYLEEVTLSDGLNLRISRHQATFLSAQ